jgi:hypothetical protein
MSPATMPLPPWTASPDGFDDDQRFVLKQNGHFGTGPPWRRGARRFGRRRRRNRRDTDHIADREPRIRPDATLVHAHLAATQNPVNVAFGDAFQDFGQKVVNALPGRIVADGEPVHSILA